MIRLLIWGIIILGIIGGGFWFYGQSAFVSDPAEFQKKTFSTEKSLLSELFFTSLKEINSRVKLPKTTSEARPTTNPEAEQARYGAGDQRLTTDNQQPATDEAKALQAYLIESSNIGFPEPFEVSFAVIAARNGDFSQLGDLIEKFKTKQEQFLKIKAPQIAQTIHQQSVKLTQSYINLLQRAYASRSGQAVQELLGSDEARTIRLKAQNVISQIKNLTEKLNIELPPEVLPKSSGLQNPDPDRFETGKNFKEKTSVFSFLKLPRLANIGGAGNVAWAQTSKTIKTIPLLDQGGSDCPYNREKTDQCGGGEFPREIKGDCRRETKLAYYTNCNYGNAPNILDPMGSLHPLDPTPACSAVDNTPACACREIPTAGCGTVKRLFPPGCGGCCPPLPVSAEQCCGGSAWLWDKVTGWVGCAE